jgi:hypothetical protein
MTMAEIPMQPTGNTVMHQIIAQAVKPIKDAVQELKAQLDRIEAAMKKDKAK